MPESLPAASIILLLIRKAGQFQKQNIYCSIYIYYFCLAYSKVWWKIHRQTNILSWIVTKWSLFFQHNLPGGLRTTSIGFAMLGYNCWRRFHPVGQKSSVADMKSSSQGHWYMFGLFLFFSETSTLCLLT